MKKLIQAVIIIAALFLCGVHALAETEGDYEFKIKSECAVITKAAETLSGEVIVPDTLGGYAVSGIDSFAFAYNTNIEKVIIPSSVKVIGPYAFFHCFGVEEVELNEGLEEIGHYSFSSTTLNEIKIPQTVTFIGMFAFSDSDVEEIEIGKNISKIAAGAFSYCPKLEKITADVENEYYSSFGGVLFTKDKTTLVAFPSGKACEYNIPEGVTTIYGSAFESCRVSKLILPDSLTSVGELCFLSNDIKVLYINKSVRGLSFSGLDYCNNLTDIYYNGSEDDWKKLDLSSYNLPKGATVSYNTVAENCVELVFDNNGAQALMNTDGMSGYVVCALYKNDCLTDVANKKIDGASTAFAIEENDFDTLKIFVFDSIESLIPVCEANVL